jgi:hypothetical protein
MLSRETISRKKTMVSVSYYFPKALAATLEATYLLARETEQVNKTDVVREALSRGLASIRADIDGMQNLRTEEAVQS